MTPSYSFEHLPFPIPLAFDTIYYVESPDNDPLNQVMRQLATNGPIFENKELQPFAFKLLCLTREELEPERIIAGISDTTDTELLAKAINNLRQCLGADKGGTLTARCLPKFSYNEHTDDNAIYTFDNFGNTNPKKAEEITKSFAHSVAKENFRRLTDDTFPTFQQVEETIRSPHRQSDVIAMSYNIMDIKPKDLIKTMQNRLAELNDEIDDQTNFDDIFCMVKKSLERLKASFKMDIFCPIEVKDDKIYLITPERERKEIIFDRNYAKTLFVFYLQHIQRTNRNPDVPRYLTQSDLKNYKNELFEIYQFFSGKICELNDIRTLWDKFTGTGFRDANSSIGTYFKKEFDVETIKEKYHKSYFVSIWKYSGTRYGIDIDESDFTMDQFNYKKH